MADIYFEREVNEGKGHFSGGSDARFPADHLQEVQTTKEKGLNEHARVGRMGESLKMAAEPRL